MREMRDRLGSPRFLAAYNAGPAHYDDYPTSGRPLPEKSRRYVADVAPRIGVRTPEFASIAGAEALSWTKAPLFVERMIDQMTAEGTSMFSHVGDRATTT